MKIAEKHSRSLHKNNINPFAEYSATNNAGKRTNRKLSKEESFIVFARLDDIGFLISHHRVLNEHMGYSIETPEGSSLSGKSKQDPT